MFCSTALLHAQLMPQLSPHNHLLHKKPNLLQQTVHASSSSQVLAFLDNHPLQWQHRSRPSESSVSHDFASVQTGYTLHNIYNIWIYIYIYIYIITDLRHLHFQSSSSPFLESLYDALVLPNHVWHKHL